MTQLDPVMKAATVTTNAHWKRALLFGAIWGVGMWYITSAMDVFALGRPFGQNAMVELPLWVVMGVIVDRAVWLLQRRMRAGKNAQ